MWVPTNLSPPITFTICSSFYCVALDTCSIHRRPNSLNYDHYHRLRSFPVAFRERKTSIESTVRMGGGKRRVESRFTAGDAKDKTIINQIMLRFRPIAPRPVAVESSVGLIPAIDGKKRAKRKYVRVKKKMNMNRTRECNLMMNDKSLLDLEKTMAMVEIGNGKEFVVTDPVQKVPNWISFDVPGNNGNNIVGSLITPAPESPGLHDVDLAMTVRRGQVVESWITMESVTGTCEDGRRLGYTDEEIWKDLETDSCPGFISNGYDEVQWVNLAYRRMVDPNPDGGAPPPEVLVWLGVKVEKSTVEEYWPAFSCRLRVVYQLPEKKKQMTVPCDVWKLDSGGYAWRLDVKAALSLGRLN